MKDTDHQNEAPTPAPTSTVIPEGTLKQNLAHGQALAPSWDSRHKLRLGPEATRIEEVVRLIQDLRECERMSRAADKHELVVATRSGSTVITSNLHIDVDEELTELLQTKVSERVDMIAAKLESLGVSIDVENVLDIPSYVSGKE